MTIKMALDGMRVPNFIDEKQYVRDSTDDYKSATHNRSLIKITDVGRPSLETVSMHSDSDLIADTGIVPYYTDRRLLVKNFYKYLNHDPLYFLDIKSGTVRYGHVGGSEQLSVRKLPTGNLDALRKLLHQYPSDEGDALLSAINGSVKTLKNKVRIANSTSASVAHSEVDSDEKAVSHIRRYLKQIAESVERTDIASIYNDTATVRNYYISLNHKARAHLMKHHHEMVMAIMRMNTLVIEDPHVVRRLKEL